MSKTFYKLTDEDILATTTDMGFDLDTKEIDNICNYLQNHFCVENWQEILEMYIEYYMINKEVK